ncbi:response regulator [Streptomyces sp. SID7760]|nr:response regulator [Streptomyces sp. SID7760]
MIRVLLADDDPVIRAACTALLSLEGDMEIVAQAATGPQAIELALTHVPDVAVLDLRMPGRDGLAVAARLAQLLPACKTMIVTGHALPGQVERALAHGARAFVLKTLSGRELAAVIRQVHAGHRRVDPALATDAARTEGGERPQR